MSDILGIGGLDSGYLETVAANSKDASRADKTSAKLNNLGPTATREELESAAKSFEAYFVEQVIKEMKESVDAISDDGESDASKYTDYFMDSTIQSLAEEIVDNYGGNFTDSMVEQMARNYGINVADDGETAE